MHFIKPAKKEVFNIIAVIVLIATVISVLLSGCKLTDRKSVVTLNTISNISENYEIHCSREDNLKSHPVLSSGFIELLVDTENCSFSIQQKSDSATEKDFFWSALPVLPAGKYAGKDTKDASVVSIEVLGGTDKYSLNSQDNSVEYKKAFYDLIDNGAVFTYNIYANKETAEKTTLSQTDIAFSVKLTVTLIDGSMYVNCEHKNLSGNKNAKITKLNVLNWFGAYNASEKDDFIFVPDGCGAVIKTSVKDDSFEKLSFSVYGNDISVSDMKTDGTAVVPAFGIKHSSFAFVSLITKGDAISTIFADKAKSNNEYNTVSAGFDITPYIYDGKTLTVSDNSYSGEGIELCYRFMSDSNATYSGLASACREQLIRNAVLSTRNIKENNVLPFNLSVIGTTFDSFKNIVTKMDIVTDTEQASDMVTRMKNKGINNVNLRYTGVFEGGINQKDISKSSLLWRIGTMKDFSGLFTYIDTQNMNLFLDINLLQASEDIPSSKKAYSIDGNKLTNSVENPYKKYSSVKLFKKEYRSPSTFEDLAEKILVNTRNYSFSGFCFNDIGSLLYSDYSNEKFNREYSKQTITNAVIPLTTNRKTMINYGNIYMLKNADIAVNIPMTTSVTCTGAYESVPFLQMLIHGSVDYSGKPINLSNDFEETMLKYIEYGACPYYEWGYNQLNKYDKDYYYDEWINSASEYYEKSNTVLNDLRGIRITEHSMVSDGVFLTQYENGAMIYVNYTDKDFTVSGFVVGANDFERIN